MKRIKHLLSKLIFFGGMIAMAILTVPAAILFGAIAIIKAATDVITNKLE